MYNSTIILCTLMNHFFLALSYCVSFFFFFKQKTAYEILTCDWSSDVCSSDLTVCQASDMDGSSEEEVVPAVVGIPKAHPSTQGPDRKSVV